MNLFMRDVPDVAGAHNRTYLLTDVQTFMTTIGLPTFITLSQQYPYTCKCNKRATQVQTVNTRYVRIS